jgi:hypothetical protein
LSAPPRFRAGVGERGESRNGSNPQSPAEALFTS